MESERLLCSSVLYTPEKRGLQSIVSKYRRFGVYSMNKTGVGRTFFATKASATS
jgi:hypothetical protein